MLYQKQKNEHFDNYSFHWYYYHQSTTTNSMYHRIVETSIIWSICLYGCFWLIVWYYIFIWLLVLFGRCCTFFHLQGAFLRGWITLEKSARVKKEEGAGFQAFYLYSWPTPPIYEVVAFHLLSCVCSPVWSFYVVLLKCVELKCIAFYLPCARFILFVICGAACLLYNAI